ADLRNCLNQPFDQATRKQQHATLLSRIDWFCIPHEQDPDKLRKLKARMQEWRHTLLTCLMHEGIPPDNNKAERHIRKLVLKRKKSFGVNNLKTAKTLSILMSVFWTYKHRYRNHGTPEAFLPALASLARG
ncbi:MAG: IS66 family transposase, partial [Rhabdochlamydiaceae bacterium]